MSAPAITRKRVESLLRLACINGGEAFANISPAQAEALCRAWLALDGAAEGEAVEVGNDDEGQLRVLIHSTREQLMRGPPLAFQTMKVVRWPVEVGRG